MDDGTLIIGNEEEEAQVGETIAAYLRFMENKYNATFVSRDFVADLVKTLRKIVRAYDKKSYVPYELIRQAETLAKVWKEEEESKIVKPLEMSPLII
jgi:hypothetical protein